MKTSHIPAFASRVAALLPDSVRHIPSMMSQGERALLLALARDEYHGAGVIMDAGVFCGASTACFGAGLLANPSATEILARWEKPIQTYEYGVVNPGMISFFERHQVAGGWEVGDSFEPYLRTNIARFADMVDLHMGDISVAHWDGTPIEIMFLDVLKSNAIQLAVMRRFLPSLIPGGILVQQDYFIDGVPFVKLLQEHLDDYFDYLGEIQSSAVFQLTRPIPAELFASDPVAAMSLDTKLKLLDQARDRSVDRQRRLICDLGKVRALSELGEMNAARQLLDILPAQYSDQFGSEQPTRIKTAVRAARNRAHGRVNRGAA